MKPGNSSILNAPANEYASLQRQYWQLLCTTIVFAATIGCATTLKGENWNLPRIVIYLVAGPGLCVCWVWGISHSRALYSFRCPKCHKRFAIGWLSNIPTSNCKHCHFHF